jgi:hypothetical protein
MVTQIVRASSPVLAPSGSAGRFCDGGRSDRVRRAVRSPTSRSVWSRSRPARCAVSCRIGRTWRPRRADVEYAQIHQRDRYYCQRRH